MKKIANMICMPLVMAGSLMTASPAAAAGGFEPFIGEIAASGRNFCPRGWLDAAGQLIPIAQNTALFSLLGTQFGGNGQTNFALPDMRGRSHIGDGQGPGLPMRSIGQLEGSESVTILATGLPAHTHTASLKAFPTVGESPQPVRNRFAQALNNKHSNAAATGNMAAGDVLLDPAGGNQPVGVMQPYLAMRYCIATQGIYPPRP